MSLESLARKLPNEIECAKLESYFNGESRLDALGVNLPAEVRVLELMSPYPRLSAEVLAEVLTFVGFTLGEDPDDERLKTLSRIFQANNMETQIRLSIIEALVQGGAYFVIGPNGPGGKPRITAHQYKDVAVDNDWLGRPTEALIRWSVGPSTYDKRRAHYTTSGTRVYEKTRSGWKEIESEFREPTLQDRVPVFPMLNKARLGDTQGRSEILQVLGPSDAASRTLTGLQVAQELEVMPKSWIFADGAKDAFGTSAHEKLKVYMGNLNYGPEGGSVQQLRGASLEPIISSYKLYAQIISSITGIPPSMLGISTDNPSSAEAMRVAKDRLSSKGELKIDIFGDCLEDLARGVLEMNGDSEQDLDLLQSVWRDVATPSRTSQQAVVLQAFQAGMLSKKTARDFIDLTPAQRQYEDEQDRLSKRTGEVVRTGDLVRPDEVPGANPPSVPAPSDEDPSVG